MSDRLEQIAERVKSAVKDLPKDGKEHQITVTVGGDNHGSITLGDHIVVNEQPQSYADQVASASSDSLLRERRRQASLRRAAVVRQFLNIPALLFFTVLIVVLGTLALDIWGRPHGQALLISFSGSYLRNMLVPISLAFILLGLSIPFHRRKQLECSIVDKTTQNIIVIDQEIHHRKYHF